MKCKYCGGEVGLEENFCPYCGKPNEQALRHHRDMADYRQRYEETETAVVGKARHYAQIIPRVIVILILMIAAAVMAWVSENVYAIPEEMRRHAAEKHPETVMAELDGYLEDRDYLSFSSCFTYNGLRTYGTAFADYSDVEWCAEDYSFFVQQMEKLFLHRDHEKWVKADSDIDIRRLCDALDDFEDIYARAQRNTQKPLHQAAMNDMKENVRDMLRVYLGIREEEMEEFLALSDIRKAARIEEVLFGA